MCWCGATWIRCSSAAGSEVIARYPRSYDREDFVYDPIHYLPLLEQKIGALDQAAPLQGWDLPEELGTLRRLLESRMGRRGQREFVQALRLLETFSMGEVHAAIKNFLRLGAISFGAVKRLALCRLEGRPPGLDLELYPCCGGARFEPGPAWNAGWPAGCRWLCDAFDKTRVKGSVL